MTSCKEAYDALAALGGRGGEAGVARSTMDELRSLGLVASAAIPAGASNAEAQLASMRERLAEMEGERRRHRNVAAGAPKGSDDARHARETLERLEREERALRTRFIDMLQATEASRGRDPHVTYLGKEAAEAIGQRMARASDMSLRELMAELDSIRTYFDSRTADARKVLEVIARRLRKVEEIHLRTASVGLAMRDGPPEETARLFERAYEVVGKQMLVPGPAAITLAEALTVRAADEGALDASLGNALRLLREPWGGADISEDQARAAAIIVPSGMDQDRLVARSRELMASLCPESPSAAAYMASLEASGVSWGGPGHGLEDEFRQMLAQVERECPTGTGRPIAAALLLTPGQPPAFMMRRFAEAKAILDRFDGDEMVVPAAIVAILPSGVEEAMDNARLAAAAVMRHKLSLGGFENLSLGVKLLTQSAMLASMSRQGGAVAAGAPASATGTAAPAAPTAPAAVRAIAPPPVLAFTSTPITLALAMGAGLLAFHEVSYHRFSVQYGAFHPVHMHFVYG